MKVLFTAIALVAITLNLGGCKSMADTAQTHNSQNALDWEGLYKGTVLSGTGEKSVLLQLQKDLTYSMRIAEESLNQQTESTGRFTWNSKGNEITLKQTDTGNQTTFLVGENSLTRKGSQGLGMSAQYILSKVPEDGITEKYWKLIELNGKPIGADDQLNKEPYMMLKHEGDRVVGTGGCNSFTGGYKIDNAGRIKFTQIVGTMMACLNMEVEVALYHVLETTDSYSLSEDGKFLSLNKARMAPLARFEVVYK